MIKTDKTGLIATNLAEKIASCVTENPYCVTTDIISSINGRRIIEGHGNTESEIIKRHQPLQLMPP